MVIHYILLHIKRLIPQVQTLTPYMISFCCGAEPSLSCLATVGPLGVALLLNGISCLSTALVKQQHVLLDFCQIHSLVNHGQN